MKNIILCIFLVCFGIVGYSQYTAIPDPKFENYLEQHGMGDGIPNNGLVLTSNINTVKQLGVSMLGIKDLTGIEDFSDLEILGCANNLLTSLDLSQNQKLAGLNLIDNRLTNLILPASTDLYIIYCNENFLTELDISKNPNLVELNCKWNKLTGLDTSQNPELTYLFCSYNKIEGYFDTSQNPELILFSASFNNISAVDFTQNPVLNSFGAYSNPLRHVDVRNGNNQNMQTFDVTGSGGLKCIFVDDASASYLTNWLKDPYTHFVNNQEECDLIGVENFTANTFSMYPNPATNEVFISLSDQTLDVYDISITNSLGQVLQRKTNITNSSQTSLNVSGYSAGIYFVTIQAGNSTATKKLVVR